MNTHKKPLTQKRDRSRALNPSWEWAGREIEFHLGNFRQETESALTKGTGRSSIDGCERSRALRLSWAWTEVVNPSQCTEQRRSAITKWFRRFLTVLFIVKPANPLEEKQLKEFRCNLRMRLNDMASKNSEKTHRVGALDLLEEALTAKAEKESRGPDFKDERVRSKMRSLCLHLLEREAHPA